MKNFKELLVILSSLILISSVAIADVSTDDVDTFARTKVKKLNVRNAPEGDKITMLFKGCVVSVLETNGNWSRVMYLINNDPETPQYGWVSSQYIEKIQSSPVSQDTQVADNHDSEHQTPLTSTLPE